MEPASDQRKEKVVGSPISEVEFQSHMARLGPFVTGEKIAVAVSGGPDSMALCCLAHFWAKDNSCHVVALTVDHRLRQDSAKEADQVSIWLNARGMEHHTLPWPGGEEVSRLDRSAQAAARDARFDLLTGWCRDNGVQKILLAHHADDQVETFLQRLVRGSGLDGLAAMQSKTVRHGVSVLRPLLSFKKADLISTCNTHDQAWLEDPSNQDDKYSRVRLRKLLADLSAEGLDTDRMLKTVGHLQRAKSAIDTAVEELRLMCVGGGQKTSLQIQLDRFLSAPEEVGLRLLAACLCDVSKATYPPRFDSLWHIHSALRSEDWTDRTLHGCQLRVANGVLTLELEPKERQNSA